VEALLYEHGLSNIMVCCETNKIENNLAEIFTALGVDGVALGTVRHGGAGKPEWDLTEAGRRNLEKHLSSEYEIYHTCRMIANDLGFD
jgi:hypothetical protein